MPSIDPFAVIAVVLVILIGVFFLLPTEQRRRRRKKKGPRDGEMKDWQALSLKLERHIHALRRELQEGQKREKLLEREAVLQKEKYARLHEKLAQERRWQHKEKGDIEKKAQDVIRLGKELKTAEQGLAREHGERLRLEKALKEAQDAAAAARDARLGLEAEIARLKAIGDEYRKQILELKEKNSQLSKKHDETTWIAKSEYEKLQKEMQFKDKELGRLKDQLRREMM